MHGGGESSTEPQETKSNHHNSSNQTSRTTRKTREVKMTVCGEGVERGDRRERKKCRDGERRLCVCGVCVCDPLTTYITFRAPLPRLYLWRSPPAHPFRSSLSSPGGEKENKFKNNSGTNHQFFCRSARNAAEQSEVCTLHNISHQSRSFASSLHAFPPPLCTYRAEAI